MLTKIHNTIYAIEKTLLILAIFSISLLFLFQFFHVWDGNISTYIFKSLLHLESYDTKPILSAGKITLSLSDNQQIDSPIAVLINGEIQGKFEYNQIDIIVRSHDVISIDVPTDYLDSIKVKVINIGNNILSPKINDEFILNRGTNQLFSVEFR